MKKLIALGLAVALVPAAAQAQQLVAQEDFDGGAVNLISSDALFQDGGGGDAFGPGSITAWPQGTGIPFGLVDDSVTGISGAPFATDNEAVYGQASDFDNVFFALSDTRDFGVPTASWTFNVDGFENLELSVDAGGVSNDSFGGYSLSSSINFTVSFDNGAPSDVLLIGAIDNPGFVTRPMDSGLPSGGGALLQATGPNGVTKTNVDTGAADSNTYLDKSPADGPNAGKLDTFTAPIVGVGQTMTLTVTADLPFEAAAFDNIVIRGTAQPVSSEDSSFGAVKNLFN